MQVPLELTFRGVEKEPGLEDLIRERAERLDRISGSLISCRIAVERPQEHQRAGNPFRVRIDMRLPPGQELVVRSEPGNEPMHETLRTVVHDAFNSAERSLRRLSEQLRGRVKTHPEQEPSAFVVRLFRERGYGFIRDRGGTEYYFHRNSVLNGGFDRLRQGTPVRFAAEEGEKGPQASTVELLAEPPR